MVLQLKELKEYKTAQRHVLFQFLVMGSVMVLFPICNFLMITLCFYLLLRLLFRGFLKLGQNYKNIFVRFWFKWKLKPNLDDNFCVDLSFFVLIWLSNFALIKEFKDLFCFTGKVHIFSTKFCKISTLLLTGTT